MEELAPAMGWGPRAFAATVFAIVGLFGFVVGVHDTFAAFEFGSRTGGMLLLLAGMTLIAVAVILLVRTWAWGPTVGILAAPVGMVIGISLIVENLLSPDRSWAPAIAAFVITAVVVAVAASRKLPPWILCLVSLALLLFAYTYFSQYEYDQRLIFWALIVNACALAAYALWKVHPLEVSGPSSTKVLGGVFGFLTVGALVGGAQFWYTSQYLPSNEGASLSIESELRRLAPFAGKDVAELALTVENTSPTQAEILSSVYRVSGATVETIHRGDGQIVRWLGRPEVRGSTVSRFRRGFDWDLVQAGRIFLGPTRLDPRERFSTSALVYLPHGRYDALRAQAQILFAKHRSLSLDYGGEHRYAFNDWARGVVRTLPIEETSWLRQLTHGNRKLQLQWITSNDREPRMSHFPYLAEVVIRDGEEASPSDFASYNNQTTALYGVGSAVSKKEMPLYGGG